MFFVLFPVVNGSLNYRVYTYLLDASPDPTIANPIN